MFPLLLYFFPFFLPFIGQVWEMESPCVRTKQALTICRASSKLSQPGAGRMEDFFLLAWSTNQWFINRNKKKSKLQSSPLYKVSVDSVSRSTFACRLEPSYCCSRKHPPAVTAAESFPWELGFPLTFIAGHSHQAKMEIFCFSLKI